MHCERRFFLEFKFFAAGWPPRLSAIEEKFQTFHTTLLSTCTGFVFIVAMTKALTKQVIEHGIWVNAVAPGPIWNVLQPSGGQPREKIADFGGHPPMKRPGQPAECAPLYVFLASRSPVTSPAKYLV